MCYTKTVQCTQLHNQPVWVASAALDAFPALGGVLQAVKCHATAVAPAFTPLRLTFDMLSDYEKPTHILLL